MFNIASRVPHSALMRVASLQYRYPLLKPVLQAIARNFRNRDAVMQNGIGRGLKFNTAGSIAGYALGNSEPDLQKALQLLVEPGITVFDVGANVGFFSVLMARLVGPRGQVFSFEPVPANARQIQYNAQLNHFYNIHVDAAAMGDAEGTAAFRVSDFPTTGKLRSTGIDGPLKEEIPVSTRQLDVVVYRPGGSVPALLKIDAEGAEVAILKGAAKLLAHGRPVFLIEFHNTNAAVTEILERNNYSVHVLGSSEAPRNAHWNSRVIALPREHARKDALIRTLTDPALLA